jgi:hypothetical protein
LLCFDLRTLSNQIFVKNFHTFSLPNHEGTLEGRGVSGAELYLNAFLNSVLDEGKGFRFCYQPVYIEGTPGVNVGPTASPDVWGEKEFSCLCGKSKLIHPQLSHYAN